MWKLKQALNAKFGSGSLEARCPVGWIVVLPGVDRPPVTTEFARDEVIDQSDLARDIGDRIRSAPSILQLATRGDLALLWQIFSYPGFPNQFFCDSWVVGFWRSRPWLAGHWIGRQSLGGGSSRFWIGWVTRRGDACVRSTYRG